MNIETTLHTTDTSTQPINGPLFENTQVSRYQKKHSPIHTHEEEEGFAQTIRSALSQQWLPDPVKPAYNQSRPDSQIKFNSHRL